MENSKQVIQYLEELAKALTDLSVTSPFHIHLPPYRLSPRAALHCTLVYTQSLSNMVVLDRCWRICIVPHPSWKSLVERI